MTNLNLTANGKPQELILAYLKENVSDILAEKINSGTPFEKDGKQLLNRKDLDRFMKYANDEARKLAEKGANSACVEDCVVYGWAIHYFEEDSIQGKLYNPDGTEYIPPKPIAKATTKTPPRATVTNTAPPPAKPKPQPSLFDLLTEQKDEQVKDVTLRTDDQELIDNPTVEQIANSLQKAVEQKQQVELRTDDHEQVDTPKQKNTLYEKYITYVNRHPDSVIAMRVGDFYEILGKRAVELSQEIGLILTSRDLGLQQRIPMIGFPYHASEAYFKKIRQKRSIVIVDDDGERKLSTFGIEDIIDGDDEMTEDEERLIDDLSEDEMRKFDGDIQEPKDIPTSECEETKTICSQSDSPYDQVALAKVTKLFGDVFILR